MFERWRVVIDLLLKPEADDVPPHEWDWPEMVGLRRGEAIERIEAMYGESPPERMDN